MNVQVVVSGPVFAALLHEHAMSPNNQDGFLIGDFCLEVTNRIDDHAAVNEQQEYVAKICSFVPCNPREFCNRDLSLDTQKLTHLLGKERLRRVIGFYSSRRNLPLTATFRERCLAAKLCKEKRGDPFIFGMFRTSYTDSFAIHSIEYAFHSVRTELKGSRLEPASFRIVNLGEEPPAIYKKAHGAGSSVPEEILSGTGSKRDLESSLRFMSDLHQNLQQKLFISVNKIEDTNSMLYEPGLDQYQF